MKKFVYLLFCVTVMVAFSGCSGRETAENSSESVQNTTDAGKKDENDREEVIDNTKQFDAVDLSALVSEDVISVQADASFATKCQTVEEIYENSDYIIKGVVQNTYFTVLEGMPYTVVNLKTEENLKGNLADASVNTVLLYGGYMTVQQEVDYYDDASRFENIEKKWSSTYIEERMTDAEYPKEGDTYVMALMDNELSEGTYAPVNEFETVFKESSDQYVRTLPSDDYYGNTQEQQKTYLDEDISISWRLLKKQCKALQTAEKKS